MAAVFVILYGVMTFMSLVEALVFVTRIPQGMLPRLFLMGAVVAAPFSVLAVLRDTPWLIPFQLLRALLCALLALPVVRLLKGSRRESALAVGALFAVLMNAQLLLPNPYMPAGMLITHLIETASSNFIFGFLVGWLLA